MGKPKEGPTMPAKPIRDRYRQTDRSAAPFSAVYVHEWVILWVTAMGESEPRPCPDPYPGPRLNGTWAERAAHDQRIFGPEIERVVRHRNESMTAFKARVEKRTAELTEDLRRP